MIHTKTKDVVTRLDAFCIAFGRQGGTIHQIAEKTGCKASDLIFAESEEWNIDHSKGWFAYQTCSLEYNQKHMEQQKGNLQYWLGVAGGVQTSIKRQVNLEKKF